MCVIIELQPQTIFPYDPLRNAILNNPHGVGIVYSDNKDVRVERYLPDNPNPDFVMKLLEKDSSATRFLHLRHRTRGPIDKHNLHPFPVIIDKHNSLYMMHNGTFNDIGTIASNESDSQVFARDIMAPILRRVKFPGNKIDVKDDILKLLFKKYVIGHNRILLVNNGSYEKFGNWSEFKAGGESFQVSNTQYFDSVMAHRGASTGGASYGNTGYGFRGQGSSQETVAQREEAAKAADSRTTAARMISSDNNNKADDDKVTTVTTTPKITKDDKPKSSWSESAFVSTKPGVTSITHLESMARKLEADRIRNLSQVFATTDSSLYDPVDLINIGYLEDREIVRALRLVKEDDVAFLLRSLSAEYEEVVNDLEKAKDKQDKATKRIATLEAELQEIRANERTG